MGYTIRNNGATTSGDLWVTLSDFTTGGRIALAPNEDGIAHIGPLAPGASTQVYFYLQDTGTNSGTNSTVTVNNTYQVNLFTGSPSAGGTENCDYVDTVVGIEDTQAANANKIFTSIAGPNPATIGGIMTMTVVGETGTIGAAQVFAPTPAADVNWPANAYQLADVHIDYWNGTTCPDAVGGVPGSAPTNTYTTCLA